MEKTSKVIQVTGNGTWESPQYGLFYKFEIVFDNADCGEYMSKTLDQTKFRVGEDATYTIDGKEYNGRTFYRVKPFETKPAYNGGGGFKENPDRELRIARMSVLKAAIDLCSNGIIPLQKTIEYSKYFESYVMEGKDLIPKGREEGLPF